MPHTRKQQTDASVACHNGACWCMYHIGMWLVYQRKPMNHQHNTAYRPSPGSAFFYAAPLLTWLVFCVQRRLPQSAQPELVAVRVLIIMIMTFMLDNNNSNWHAKIWNEIQHGNRERENTWRMNDFVAALHANKKENEHSFFGVFVAFALSFNEWQIAAE